MQVRYAKDNRANFIGLVKVFFDNSCDVFSAKKAQEYVDYAQSRIHARIEKIFVAQAADGKINLKCYLEKD